MAIATNRQDLVEGLTIAFGKLDSELDGAGTGIANLVCVDGLTVKDLLAVRLWWTNAVLGWVAAREILVAEELPTTEFRWSDTPRLNQQVAKQARTVSYQQTRKRLKVAFQQSLTAIDGLTDQELLTPKLYEWSGNWPLARWVAINTTRQYTTARAHIRKTIKNTPAKPPPASQTSG